MSEKNLLTLLIVGAALYVFGRRTSSAAGSPLLPVGTGGPAGAIATLGEMPGGGFIFPRLPDNAYYTSDPATGQVYVVADGYGGSAMPWVSTSDILRGRS